MTDDSKSAVTVQSVTVQGGDYIGEKTANEVTGQCPRGDVGGNTQKVRHKMMFVQAK